MAISDFGRPSPRQRRLSGLPVSLMESTYPVTNPLPNTFPLIPILYASKIGVSRLILIRLGVVHQGPLYSAHHLPFLHDYRMGPLYHLTRHVD